MIELDNRKTKKEIIIERETNGKIPHIDIVPQNPH